MNMPTPSNNAAGGSDVTGILRDTVNETLSTRFSQLCKCPYHEKCLQVVDWPPPTFFPPGRARFSFLHLKREMILKITLPFLNSRYCSIILP